MAVEISRGTVDQRTEVHGIVQTVAAGLIALTVVDSIMVLVNRSSAPFGVRMAAVKYGEWLFLPATLTVCLTSRAAGARGYLALAGSLAIAFTALTQFRGPWVWNGTFDYYYFDRTPWVRVSLIGIGLALVLGRVLPSRGCPSTRSTIAWLVALALSLATSALLPVLLPNDSEFAATRAFIVGTVLVGLTVVMLLNGDRE